jgi:hypothetical protein
MQKPGPLKRHYFYKKFIAVIDGLQANYHHDKASQQWIVAYLSVNTICPTDETILLNVKCEPFSRPSL